MAAIADVYRSHLGESLISIVLFGSLARGEATEASDLDLFIVARDLPKHPLERVKLLHEPKITIREGISARGKTPEEFESYLAPMYLDIALDGIILFDRDNYMAAKIAHLRQLLRQVGLNRVRFDGEMAWEWERQPKPGWELEWGGLIEVA